MTTINLNFDQLEYLKGRVDRFTARALEAEERYIWLYDSPTATQAELDFARWEYEVTLKELGRVLNKYLNLQYSELHPGIDKRITRAA